MPFLGTDGNRLGIGTVRRIIVYVSWDLLTKYPRGSSEGFVSFWGPEVFTVTNVWGEELKDIQGIFYDIYLWYSEIWKMVFQVLRTCNYNETNIIQKNHNYNNIKIFTIVFYTSLRTRIQTQKNCPPVYNILIHNSSQKNNTYESHVK